MDQKNVLEDSLSLDELRKQIDEVDSQIVALYEERMIISEGIAKAKMAMNKPIFDESREQIKLDGVVAKVKDEKNSEGIKNVFRVLMDESKKLQRIVTEGK